MGFHEALAVLVVRPPQRKAEDLRLLAAVLQQQPFFAGVDFAALQEICSALTFHQAAPGEVVLHAGELTDRMYLLLSGTCSVVRHSRKEGFQPQPPELLLPGQALCEASLMVSGRRSDVAVKVETPAGAVDGASEGAVAGAGGGAAFAVLSRAAWSSVCTRAPLQPVCAQARTALLCCCARSLAAASAPGHRTLEQADDLEAVLKHLPGLSLTPDPVLRAMSESVVLHRLPPGAIMFEENTRAEAEFVVLGGMVQVRRRRRRLGARATTAAPRKARNLGTPSAAVADGGKSVREKIEEERKAREALKESLALTRDGLRELKAPPPPPPPKSVYSSQRWMTEFVDRARKLNPGGNAEEAPGEPPHDAMAAGGGLGPVPPGAPGAIVSSNGNMSRAAQAWRRAVMGVVPIGHSEVVGPDGGGAGGSGGAGGGATGDMQQALEAGGDALLAEYERLKEEEAGHVTDVGNLLGGAGSREAYLRGILEARSRRGYGYDTEQQERLEEEPEQGSDDAADVGEGEPGGDEDEDDDLGGGEGDCLVDPLLRMRYLDRHFQLTSKVVRFEEAAETLARLVEARGWDSRAGASPEAAAAAEPTIQSVPAADLTTTIIDDAACLATSSNATAVSRAARGGRRASYASSGPGGLIEGVTAPTDDHIAQLYGPDIGGVDAGQMAGELPEAALCRAAGLGGGGGGGGGAGQTAPLLRRADTAIAGASGADVLVVALEALRRGHEAARDDLVSERLAVLTALEPLRGLSDEHQAQLALACTVTALDAHQLIARQGQAVDALYVVLDGEVRLLDDPMDGLVTTAIAPAAAPPGAGGNAAAAAAFAAGGRSMSLNGSSFSRRAAAIAAAAGMSASTNGRGAAGSGSGGGAPPQAAAGANGGHASIRVRRALAALPALSLLGPGGSFGESVLGYPEDVVAAAEAAAQAEQGGDRKDGGGGGGDGAASTDEDSTDSGEDAGGTSGFALGASAHLAHRRSTSYVLGNGGSSGSSGNGRRSFRGDRGNALPAATTYLASAVTSRPSRLLVLPRSVLVKYGYLRISLPPFASLRREALNGRRQQLKAGLQTLPGVAMGLLPSPAPPAAAAAVGQGAGAAASAAGSAAGGDAAGRSLARSPSMPAPRPPPPRPIEFLEQMGFKALSNPRTAAILGSLSGTGGSGAGGGSGGGSGSSTPDYRRIAAAAAASATDAPSPDSTAPGVGGTAAAGGGKGVGGGLSVSSLALAERLRRLGFSNSPDNTGKVAVGGGGGGGVLHSSALWQYLESTGDSLVESAAVNAVGADTRPSMEGDGVGGEMDSATADSSAAGVLSGPDAGDQQWGGAAGAGGDDALRAPPKPCVVRTSLTGFRQYGSGGGAAGNGIGLRQLPAMRNSLSGLPLISSSSEKGGSAGGASSTFLSRRATFHHAPPFLRTDMLASADGAAVALLPGADGDSPRSLHLGGFTSLPPPISPAAAAAAAFDASSPTAAAAAATQRGMAAITLPSLGTTGSHPEGPQSVLTGGGGGSGDSPGVPRMRTSFNGTASLPTQGLSALRESVPGAPSTSISSQHPQYPALQYQQQQQQQQQQQRPQLNLYPTNFSASSPRSRLRGSSSRTLPQYEFGGQETAAAPLAAAAPPSPMGVKAFGATGVGPAVYSGGRQAWRELPDVYAQMRSSWDGAPGRAASGGLVVSRGGTAAATALALATLAANAPPEVQYLLVP